MVSSVNAASPPFHAMKKRSPLPHAERTMDPHLPGHGISPVGIGTFTSCEVAAGSQGPFPPPLLIRTYLLYPCHMQSHVSSAILDAWLN